MIKIVLTTMPNLEAAQVMAQRLIECSVAACVNIIPQISSVYRWEGKLEQASESLLIIKTSVEVLSALKENLAKLHPYVVPEIVVLDSSDVSTAYADWVQKSVIQN